MADFTPGPWYLDGELVERWEDGACLLASESAGPICTLSFMESISEEEARATADILAAAPDLFEVVRRAVDAGVFATNSGKLTHLGEAANAALAKSKGEGE